MNNAERPAFANPGGDLGPGSVGLTKREYFAAMALSGLLAPGALGLPTDYPYVAEKAVKIADELLKQLEYNP